MAGLILAGLVVAWAISLDGAASRAVNGVGAMLWIGSTGILLTAFRRDHDWLLRGGLAIVVAVLLSVFVEPDSIPVAMAAFAIGGGISAVGASRPLPWSMVVAGLWLPVHLLTAVVPAVVSGGGDGNVRADPPPTAAFVPLSMVVGAALGGLIIGLVLSRWRIHRSF